RRGGVFCCLRRAHASGGSDHGDTIGNEFGGQCIEFVEMALCPPINDRHVTSFAEALFVQPGLESLEKVCERARRPTAEKADDWHRPLLRARRERPRGRAAEQRDELAAPHSITSSARSRNASGIVSPSALAVVRLMTSSNLDGCSTGISPGFVPRRTLSTNSAVRRNRSEKFGP